MKRMKRWGVALVTMLLCLSLCGCNELDAMQAAHGILVDDKTVVWNGHTYTLLEGYWSDLNVDHGETVYLTEPDVPVLLSHIFGEDSSVNSGGTLISYYEYESISGSSGEKIYCRNDLLTWLEDAFINGYELETYRFQYWDDFTYENRVYDLTSEQMQAVDTVLKTVDPFAVEYYESSMESVALYGYSAYDLFAEEVGWIDYVEGMYYIFRENGHEGYGWNVDCYIVPEEMYGAFDSIMEAKKQDNPVVESNPTTGYPPSVFA